MLAQTAEKGNCTEPNRFPSKNVSLPEVHAQLGCTGRVGLPIGPGRHFGP